MLEHSQLNYGLLCFVRAFFYRSYVAATFLWLSYMRQVAELCMSDASVLATPFHHALLPASKRTPLMPDKKPQCRHSPPSQTH